MPSGQSVYTTRRGEFRRIHRELSRNKPLRARTPVVFCEGDSWFSTPLSMNLLDWLVYPTPADEARGVPIHGRGGLFFRTEESGDLATEMFAPARLRDLGRWYGGFDFDIALLSAGGNDFVGKFLKSTFANRRSMSLSQAFDLVVASGRFGEVHDAYTRALTMLTGLRPKTPVVAHTYCYPIRMHVAADLAIANLGAAALLKRNAGPWIGPHLGRVLPDLADQRLFAQRLIDGFVERVLAPLAKEARFRRNFSYVDLRTEVPLARDWFDEMHPTGATFHRLSRPFADQINALFTLR
jgi:hypothetical protein